VEANGTDEVQKRKWPGGRGEETGQCLGAGKKQNFDQLGVWAGTTYTYGDKRCWKCRSNSTCYIFYRGTWCVGEVRYGKNGAVKIIE